MQPFGAEQQHDGLQIHADVGPLGPAHVAVDVAEQGGGRAEALPVLGSGPLTRSPVLPRNTECAVALLTEGGSALVVRGLQCRRGHLLLPPVPRGALAPAPPRAPPCARPAPPPPPLEAATLGGCSRR